ncbi:GntR family transcriptional regulator [Roseinatronobacter monicus]|uniref:GntR family transcriptional regulator n=1 Tax=Roseinatronobacter monicus TaxID=393481 RepID=UPI001FE52573
MNIQSYDISRQASAATLIFDAIREAIIKGDLTLGEPLRQEDIARAFNVSRIPVREAL